MCSNEALVDQLECYVDDLVECFEDFVKKSLIVITIAVGAVIGLLVYVLKIVTERQDSLSHASIVPNTEEISRQKKSYMPNNIPAKTSEVLLTDYNAENLLNAEIEKYVPDTTNKSANTLPMPAFAGFNENVLTEIELSDCAKNCEEKLKSLFRDTTNQRTSDVKKDEDNKILESKTSCCSICCENENNDSVQEKDIKLPS